MAQIDRIFGLELFTVLPPECVAKGRLGFYPELLTTLPKVRDSCAAGWVGKELLTRGRPGWTEEGWAAALFDACDDLAARGAYLNAEGEAWAGH